MRPPIKLLSPLSIIALLILDQFSDTAVAVLSRRMPFHQNRSTTRHGSGRVSQFNFSIVGSSRDIPAQSCDLPGATEALVEAALYAGRALAAEPGAFAADEDWTIQVTDALGLVMLTILVSAIKSPAVGTH